MSTEPVMRSETGKTKNPRPLSSYSYTSNQPNSKRTNSSRDENNNSLSSTNEETDNQNDAATTSNESVYKKKTSTETTAATTTKESANQNEKARDYLAKLVKDVETFELKDPGTFVYDKFQELRRQIDLQREEVKLKTDKEYFARLEEVKRLEIEANENLAKVQKVSLEEFKTVKVPEWERLLDDSKISSAKLKPMLDEMAGFDAKLKQYDMDLMMNTEITFDPTPLKNIPEFGELFVYPSPIEKHIEYNDKKNGFGYFIGEAVGDKAFGKGEISWSKSKSKYSGEWLNDKYHGKGTYYWNSGKKKGDRFEGQYWQNDRDGCGIYYFNNGDRFEGQWINDFKNGSGIHYYVDGRIERQIWENDELISSSFIE